MILRRRTGDEDKVAAGSREKTGSVIKNPFEHLKREEIVKTVEQTRASTAVTQMTEAWKKVIVPTEVFDIKNDCAVLTNHIKQEIAGIKYDAKDVAEFSRRLEMLQQTEDNFPLKAGLFLSALISDSSEENFTVYTSQLKRKPTCLGYMNTKNVFVEGGLAWGAAYRMKSGRFEVNGNIGKAGGRSMEDGELKINGNTQKELGTQMTGGKIIAYGNVVSVGGDRRGGEVHLEGENEPYIESTRGGKIYKKGELFQDGRGR